MYKFKNKPVTFYVLILLLLSGQAFAQNFDGTQGEVFKPKDSVPSNYKYARWNEFDGPLTTLRIGGGMLYDFTAYAQDENSKKQVDKLEPEIRLRDLRVTLSGKFKFKRDLSWKAGIMYDGNKDSWYVRETGVMIGLPEISGSIFVGRTKEGYSQSKVMVGYAIWNQERSMSIDVIPILADGIKYLGYFPKQKIMVNLGVFTDWVSRSQSFSTYKFQTVTRIAWLPGYKDETSPLLHIGFNYRYGETKDGELQLRSKPEDTNSPYFVETEKLKAGSSNSYGAELYYRNGAFMAGTEIHAHQLSSAENANPLFLGGEAFLVYNFSGETRPYYSKLGCFGFLKVKKSVFKGGSGAWEGILRFSSLDLNDANVYGGKVWRFTPAVNWYLSDNIRFTLTYGFAVLNRFELEGKTQFFQSRIMFML